MTAEVFALNNLLCSAVVLQALRLAASGSFADASRGALVVGLALTNQHTAILFAAPLAAWVVLIALRPVYAADAAADAADVAVGRSQKTMGRVLARVRACWFACRLLVRTLILIHSCANGSWSTWGCGGC